MNFKGCFCSHYTMISVTSHQPVRLHGLATLEYNIYNVSLKKIMLECVIVRSVAFLRAGGGG
jgi:hypothetical protein